MFLPVRNFPLPPQSRLPLQRGSIDSGMAIFGLRYFAQLRFKYKGVFWRVEIAEHDYRGPSEEMEFAGGSPLSITWKNILLGGDIDRFLVDCQPAQNCEFAAPEAYANVASYFGTRCHIKTKSSHYSEIGSGTGLFDENMHGMLTKK